MGAGTTERRGCTGAARWPLLVCALLSMVQVRTRAGAQLARTLSLDPGEHESVQFEF